ncbi:hypothetical protein [Actinophytocola gossypii]|uniref:RanBP2-type domain-containing protein n=1 Tax=Actinophytocola gossypii TaxID=2812003 RepID=A0ABT2JKF9_9PSEU|nr:hypothetical protein [Actinophytocola gossypii]MCT2587875.1 hypothetical protein [Actinophytocola gossypii]
MTVPLTVWSCAECETNNTLDSAACRICDGDRTALCRVVEPPVPMPWRQLEPDQRFGPSREAVRALERPFGGTPPDRAPASPPAPAPPASDGGVRRVVGVLSVVAAVGVGVALLVQLFGGLAPDDDGTAPAEPAGAPVPCPEPVARHLPEPGATLVAAYRTDRHLVTLCRLPGGQVFYDGRRRGRPATPENVISLRAGQRPDGWLARNGATTYRVTGDTLVVSDGKTVLLRDRLRPVTR